MRKNLNDHGFLDMLFATGHHSNLDTVAIKGEHRVALADKDGLAAVIGLEGVLAIGLADEGSLLHLRLQVQSVGVVADLRQIIVPRHLLHQVNSQHLGGMGVQLECLKHLLERECLVGVLLEQRLHHLSYLFLIEAFAPFLFAHSILNFRVSICKDTQFFRSFALLFLYFLYLCRRKHFKITKPWILLHCML